MEWRRCSVFSVLCFVCLFLGNAGSASGQPESTFVDDVPVNVEPEAESVTDLTANALEAGSTAAPPQQVIPTGPMELLTLLKWWVLPFAAATLICIWFTTERLVVLRRARVIPRPFVERFLHHLREKSITPEEALQLCVDNGSPVAKIFAHGVRKWGKPSVEVEQAIIDGGERQISELRKHLRILNGLATVCPLIGLLGTVWGMIEAFNGIAGSDAMGNPEKLAAAIAMALLTTAAGLLVAIPSMIIYMYLAGRIDRLVMDMDELAQEVVYSISAEALQEQRPRTSRAKNA